MQILKAVLFFVALFCTVHYLSKMWLMGTRKDVKLSVFETNTWGHIAVLWWTALYYLSLEN